MKKRIVKKDAPVPKLRVAAAVFAAAFSAAGCGEFPQCQLNYSRAYSGACRSALEKTREAKLKLQNVDGQRELARKHLEKMIHGGEQYPKGLDEYNGTLRELMECAAYVSLMGEIKRKTQKGTVRGEELEGIDAEVDKVISKMEELEKVFLRIAGQK